MKNKRGWVKIVEAFFAALLITAVMILFIGNTNLFSDETAENVYNFELGILTEIELNATLRAEILALPDNILPITLDEENFPEGIVSLLEDKTPGYLICDSKICDVGDECRFERIIEKSVYSESSFVHADINTLNPRIVKLFCWTNT